MSARSCVSMVVVGVLALSLAACTDVEEQGAEDIADAPAEQVEQGADMGAEAPGQSVLFRELGAPVGNQDQALAQRFTLR